MSNDPIFFFRLHMSELISSFVMVLGGLLIWTLLHRQEFKSVWTKRAVAAFLMGSVMFIGMMVGLVLPQGHSWGSPQSCIALALQHPWRVFHNDSNLLIIGLLYVAFQIIGAIIAFIVFIIYVWAYNFFLGPDMERRIYLSKIFKFEETHAAHVLIKDAMGGMIIAMTVLGASLMGKNWGGQYDSPTGFPVNNVQVFATAFAMMIAFAFCIMTFGVRGVLALNPFVWAVAFIIKLANAFFLDRSTITGKAIARELMSPIGVFGMAAVCGLISGGLLSVPYTVGPE